MSEVPGLCGDFDIACAARADGSTFVKRQTVAAPFHLSKTYWDGDILLVHVINQTAGLFGGDRVSTHVVVGPGARVLLSSPSAARFHPSGGREVRVAQHYEVGAGAFLDIAPEISIPQRNSRTAQSTMLDVERGGELLYLETLSPGRVASGETFAFERFAWRTDVRLGGKLIHRERAALSPKDKSLTALRALHPASYYAGLIVISPASEKWDDSFRHEIKAIGQSSGAHIAASRLSAGGWSVRAIAPDSVSLRRAIVDVRQIVYRYLGRKLPDLRRY